MGARDIWGCYERGKETISGGIGRKKCAEAEVVLMYWGEGEWMNMVAADGNSREYY